MDIFSKKRTFLDIKWTHLGGVEDHPGSVADKEEDDDDDEHLGYPLVPPLSVGGGPDIRMEDRDFCQCVLGWLDLLRGNIPLRRRRNSQDS